jgi:ribosomal protein S6--L-glutamate ligase
VTAHCSRVVLLTRQPDAHGVMRLTEAAQALDVELHALDPHEFYLYLTAGGTRPEVTPSVLHAQLGGLWRDTAIIPRLASLATEYSLSALQLLELAGARSLNPYGGLLRIRHKFSALAELAAAGLPVAETCMLHAPSDIEPAVERLGGFPVMLKFVRGSQGVGVVFAPDASTVTSVVEALNLVQYDVMLQRYYPQAQGRDLRVLVLGGEPRWTVERQAEDGAFRANYHRGGTATAVEPGAAVLETARRSAELFGLGLAGIDLIESADGYVVIEVNGSPGYATIEHEHGVDVAASIIQTATQVQ